MMPASKKLNIVLDIGKTNVKLTFVNSLTNQTVHSFRTKQKNVTRLGIKILDSNSIYEWAHKQIALIGKKYVLDKFVCTAHGTSIAPIGQDNKELLACTDYEYKFDKFIDKYKEIAPKFSESFTPFLENGLNIGQQLFYLYKKNPLLIRNTKFILNYPQYIVWKLSGIFSSEVIDSNFNSLFTASNLCLSFIFSFFISRIVILSSNSPADISANI